RNLHPGAESHTLYLELFGSAKEDEYRGAVRGFERQFGVSLRFLKRAQFLVERYQSEAGGPLAEEFALLARLCEVQFDYSNRDRVHAAVVLLDPDPDRVVFEPNECLLMRWEEGAWRVIDPLGT